MSAKSILERVSTWPEEDQEELAEYARAIEARRSGVYVLTEQESAAVQRALAQADRGEFVADDIIAEADKRHEQ